MPPFIWGKRCGLRKGKFTQTKISLRRHEPLPFLSSRYSTAVHTGLVPYDEFPMVGNHIKSQQQAFWIWGFRDKLFRCFLVVPAAQHLETVEPMGHCYLSYKGKGGMGSKAQMQSPLVELIFCLDSSFPIVQLTQSEGAGSPPNIFFLLHHSEFTLTESVKQSIIQSASY